MQSLWLVVDALQHGYQVSPIANMVYCHVQFFSNDLRKPHKNNSRCQLQSWIWNFACRSQFCLPHYKYMYTVNLVGNIFQTEVCICWISLPRRVWEKAKLYVFNITKSLGSTCIPCNFERSSSQCFHCLLLASSNGSSQLSFFLLSVCNSNLTFITYGVMNPKGSKRE